VQHGRFTYVLFFIGFLLLAPSSTLAADLQVSSDTIFRNFDRQAATGKKLTSDSAYEYLQLNYGDLKSTGLSLHVNGWGRINLADNYNNKDTAGELLHAYLQYVPVKQTFQLRAGRQYIFEGVARDSIDGIYVKTFLIPTVTVSAYGGSPVSLDTSNGRNGDFIYGGKLTHSLPKLYDVGLSYKYIADNSTRKEESLGTDLTLLFPWNISLLGHSVYNMISKDWGEHSYDMRFPLGPVTIQPFLQHFRYEGFFNNRSNTANPFRFLQGTGNTLTVVGTDVFYYPSEHEEFVLRFKNYDYKDRFKSSQFYSILAIKKLKILSEVGAEVGRMQGSNDENRYILSRGYFYWNTLHGFVTGDVMFVRYDKAIYTKRTSLFASVGIGKKFFNDRFSVKLSFDYSKDPYFDEDYRWMLKLNYLLDKTFSSLPR